MADKAEYPTHSEVVVIGGGPGGYAAAFLAADLGLDVTLVDPEENPGGVCLYRGCIPSKALLHVARLLAEAEAARELGIAFDRPKIDLDRLRSWKNEVVARLTGGLGQLSRRRKVNHIRGRAVFLDATTLDITLEAGGRHRLGFDQAVIATGSRPVTLPGPAVDSPRLLNSTTALDLEDVPDSLLVVGGGYIGLEMGTVYAALGSQVTVVEMMPGLLPGVDRDLVKILHKRLETRFAAIRVNTRVGEMKKVKGGIQVGLQGEDGDLVRETFDKVLVSIGRRPNTENLGLEKTEVELDGQGFIRVDAQRRTRDEHIFAIGDVTGEPLLAHKASHEGRAAAEVIAGHKTVFDPRAIPAVVFTDPEIAWCGLTETGARHDGVEVEVVRFPWAASGRALTMACPDGLTKLVIDPRTERILGVGLVGCGAGELIAEGVLAIEMAAVARDVSLSIHPHPTLSETLMEAAEMFYGLSTHVYRPRK